MDYSYKEPLTKEFILSRITEEDIFLKYLNIYPTLEGYFINPLRQDEHPDCKFYRDPKGTLKFKDFAYKMNIDCFNLIQLVEPDVDNYGKALERIARDFRLYEKDINYEVVKNWQEIINTKNKLFSSIRVKRKDWIKSELDWFWEQGISKETLTRYKVNSLQMLWLNDQLIYQYRKSDPGYIQQFGTGYEYKAYFPLRDKYRFLQNVRGRLQGYEQLPEFGDAVIVTQSNKAVMAISEHGIPAVAPLSESILMSEEQFEDLNNRFVKIFTLFDRDRVGMWLSQQIRKKYNTIPLLFDSKGLFRSKEEPKDWNDHHKKFGTQYMLDLVEEIKQQYL